MSANNYLSIEKVKGGFRVSNIDADGCGGYLIQDAPFKKLEEAIKAANKYQDENYVEYGLQINLNIL